MTNYFVSQAGAGSKDGTSPADAWDLAGVTWASVAQNTLYVLDDWTTQFVIGGAADGIATARTIIRGNFPGRNYSSTYTAGHNIINNGAEYCDITGFTVGGNTGSFGAINVSFNNTYNRVYGNTFNKPQPIWMNGPDNCEVFSNTLYIPDAGFSGRGIRVWNTATNNKIYNNTIYCENNLQSNFVTGIEIESDSNEVYRNNVNNIAGDGIMFRSDNNVCYANIIGPYCYSSLNFEDADNNEAYHNYVGNYGHENNPDQPCLKLGDKFGAGSPSDGNVIRNNILDGDGVIKRVLQAGGGGSGTTNSMGDNNVFSNNIYYHANPPDAFGIIYVHDSTRNTYYTFNNWLTLGYDTDSISADPQLDAEFRPEAGSPAIGLGERLKGYTQDFNRKCFGNPPACGALRSWT